MTILEIINNYQNYYITKTSTYSKFIKELQARNNNAFGSNVESEVPNLSFDNKKNVLKITQAVNKNSKCISVIRFEVFNNMITSTAYGKNKEVKQLLRDLYTDYTRIHKNSKLLNGFSLKLDTDRGDVQVSFNRDRASLISNITIGDLVITYDVTNRVVRKVKPNIIGEEEAISLLEKMGIFKVSIIPRIKGKKTTYDEKTTEEDRHESKDDDGYELQNEDGYESSCYFTLNDELPMVSDKVSYRLEGSVLEIKIGEYLVISYDTIANIITNIKPDAISVEACYQLLCDMKFISPVTHEEKKRVRM